MRRQEVLKLLRERKAALTDERLQSLMLAMQQNDPLDRIQQLYGFLAGIEAAHVDMEHLIKEHWEDI